MIKERKDVAQAECKKLEDTVREEMSKSTGGRMSEVTSTGQERPSPTVAHGFWTPLCTVAL